MDQEKILGYFIEEAQEHLETLERGILNLATVVEDHEQVNEMFRAAHSVKGGAAMLGYSSIQKTAHRLEDSFKVLKDTPITVDQKLESLFLKGYDVLQDLIEKLQSPTGLEPNEADSIVEGASQQFEELQNYLNYLKIHKSGVEYAEQKESEILASPNVNSDLDIATEIKKILRKMLQVFRQESSSQTRRKLEEYCGQLGKLAPKQDSWQHLLSACRQAIANPIHSYPTLAPVVLKGLKQGCDCFSLDRPEDIQVGKGLKQLASSQLPQILIPLDPVEAAIILKQAFDEQQCQTLIRQMTAQT